MNHFMRAHGHLPGPTQRPVTAGLLSGTIGIAPSLSFAWYSGALTAGASGMSVGPAVAAGFIAIFAALGGGLYGRTFMRAADDRQGGWLFGIGFGFLLWMLGPSTVVYLMKQVPVATGRASQALFTAHLIYGLVLGIVFPFVHRIIQRKSLLSR